MADNPLFYKSIVPLNRETHKSLGLKASTSPYAFAKGSHMIPALVEEFGAASRHLPIVFLMGTSGLSPVFLVGLKPGRNDFVSEDGQWTGGYIPAFLRRYPFMFGEIRGRDPVVCIDDAYEGLSSQEGEKLFDDEGAETPMLRDKIKFVNDYFQSARRSELLGKRVQEHDLLRAISLEAKLPGGGGTTMHGFFAVDENKLAALSDTAFLQLRKDGLIGPIYAHLLSLSAVDKLNVQTESAAATAA